jgi:hypothetical protein
MPSCEVLILPRKRNILSANSCEKWQSEDELKAEERAPRAAATSDCDCDTPSHACVK